MKDIIANRLDKALDQNAFAVDLGQGERLAVDGPDGRRDATSAIADKAFAKADARRKKHSLPGLNSPAMNKLIWENWDWGAKGEEWTLSTALKLSVIDRLLRPNIDLELVICNRPRERSLDRGAGVAREVSRRHRRFRSVRA